MPASNMEYSKIKEYQSQAASLTGQAGQYNAGSNVLGDKVMEAVRTDRTSRGVSKLATDVGNVSGQMVTDPTQIREGPQSLSGQGLVDPFSVNQLTSNARAQNLKTLGTVATQGLMNQGSIDEVIKAGADQLRARAAETLAKAEEATQMAASLQQEFENSITEREMALKEQPSGGGNDWGSILANFLNNQNKQDDFQEDYDYSQAVSRVAQPEPKKFSFTEGYNALTPKFIKDPGGWAKNAATKISINWALNLLKKKK
jgi:hypothetical protein